MLVRVQHHFIDDSVLILHPEKRMICSHAKTAVLIPEGYQMEINPWVTDQFLTTDRPCDCSACEGWSWSITRHARGTLAATIEKIQKEHPDYDQQQIIQACYRAAQHDS